LRYTSSNVAALRRKLGGDAALGLTLIQGLVSCSSSSNTSTRSAQPTSSSGAVSVNQLGAGTLPGQTTAEVTSFPSYYDAHKDIVIVTDAFPKSAAAYYHANYAPSLSVVKPASQPLWYLIKGPAAPSQITVLGSEPGESDYSPLWRTVQVSWKSGVTPVLLTSDNMINNLAAKGELTAAPTSQIVNAAVISVEKSS
jgi:hypothetical protein